jgi:CRP/FNR family transcriptional regulator, cyclic AMP receptor protein
MLAQLPGGLLSGLAAAHPAWRFPAGKVLCRQGDPAGSVLILLDGQATAVTDHADGTRYRYPLMTAPCVFDKAAVLAGTAYPATWTAATAGHALTLSAAQFRALLAEQRPVREHVLRYLAVEVSQVRAALSTRTLGPAAVRVAGWLLAASESAKTPLIRLPAGQQGMAEELGLSRVTVNRALQHLLRIGAVRTRPRAIVVLDPAMLASIRH